MIFIHKLYEKHMWLYYVLGNDQPNNRSPQVFFKSAVSGNICLNWVIMIILRKSCLFVSFNVSYGELFIEIEKGCKDSKQFNPFKFINQPISVKARGKARSFMFFLAAVSLIFSSSVLILIILNKTEKFIYLLFFCCCCCCYFCLLVFYFKAFPIYMMLLCLYLE